MHVLYKCIRPNMGLSLCYYTRKKQKHIQGTTIYYNQGAKGGKAKARAQNASRMQQQLSLFSSPPWEQNACQQCYTYLLQPCLSKLCLGQPLTLSWPLGKDRRASQAYRTIILGKIKSKICYVNVTIVGGLIKQVGTYFLWSQQANS